MKKYDPFFLVILSVAMPLIGACFAMLFADDTNTAVIMAVTPSLGVIVGMLAATIFDMVRRRRASNKLCRAVKDARKELDEARAR